MPHAVCYQEEVSNFIPPPTDDLDGESLGEEDGECLGEEAPEAGLRVTRALDEELERVATPAESSVLPSARSVEMDAILEAQQRNLAKLFGF